MKQVEIERKFLIRHLPEPFVYLDALKISQGYVSVSPLVRIRQANLHYFLTCKTKGLLSREEFEISITEHEFKHLETKLDYPLLQKTRYVLEGDANLKYELDIFEGPLAGLRLVEVEFASEEEALSFIPPQWFGNEVTYDSRFHNSSLAKNGLPELEF